jgi:hypothetical protein
MSERFLIEAKNPNGIPITPPQDTRSEEGYLKDLTVEGILEILTGGMIKNTAETYLIDDSGLTLFGTGDIETKMNGDALEVGTVSGGWIASLSPIELNIALSAFPGNRIKITSDEIRFYNAGGLRGTIAGFVGFSDTTNATNKDTGAITTEGGIGVEKDIFVGGKATVANTTDSTSTTTGAMQTAGGLGVAKNVHIGGDLYAPKVGIVNISDGDSPYTVTATDSYIAVDNGANAVTINLPAGTTGRKITIYDRSGSASAGTITINRAGSNTINGGTSTTLTTNYQSVTLLFNVGNWTII